MPANFEFCTSEPFQRRTSYAIIAGKRLTLLHAYLEDFWKSVDEGAKSLQAVEELKIGDVLVSVVEYQPGLLVLRVKGENKRYTVKTLPAKVALTLAERVLKPDDPQNKVFFGTFLLMDGKGDREVARKLWSEAQQAKIDVSALLPELGTAPPASLPVEIPPLTSIMRKLLTPASWALRLTVPGQEPRLFRDLSYSSPEFQQLTWVGFTSNATVKTAFYLDNAEFQAENKK